MANSTQSVGTSLINGKHVSLELEQDEKFGKKILFRGADDGIGATELVIKYQSIVGIDRSTNSDSIDLLYLDFDESTAKPDLSDAGLRSVKIEKASDVLLTELQFTKSSEELGERSYLRSIADDRGASPRLQVIVSVGSGTGKAEKFNQDVLSPLLQRHLGAENYDVHHTTSDTSIIQLARSTILPRAQNGTEQAIGLLSGDGGMIDILNVLYEEPHSPQYRPPSIAILPLGTGNALANSSSSADDHTYGLRSLLNGSLQALPTFRATFSSGARYIVNEGRGEAELLVQDGVPTAYGAVVSSWGLHAALVADSDTVEYRKHGTERFKMAANEAMFPSDGSKPHPYQGTLKVLPKASQHTSDWTTVDGEDHAYVLATFVSQLEAGFTISPSSAPLDGVLRLIRFGPLSGNETMEIMTKAYQQGGHVKDDRVLYQDIDGLRIEFREDDARWRRVCIDGKIVRVEKNGWIEVRTDVEPAVNLIATY